MGLNRVLIRFNMVLIGAKTDPPADVCEPRSLQCFLSTRGRCPLTLFRVCCRAGRAVTSAGPLLATGERAREILVGFLWLWLSLVVFCRFPMILIVSKVFARFRPVRGRANGRAVTSDLIYGKGGGTETP